MTALAALFALAVAVDPATAAAAAPSVTLTAQKAVTRSIDAYPRVTAPASPATVAVNAVLAQADDRVRNAWRVCRQQDQDHGAWNRTTTAPFTYGPYLTLMASDEWYCGGGYTDTFTVPLTFDMATGAPLDWSNVFPVRIGGLPTSGAAGDGGKVDELLSPILGEVYKRKALRDMDGDARAACTSAFERELPVMLWLDAEREAVIIKTTVFPHVAAACAVEVELSPNELGQLSASPALIEALKAGHAAHAWTKTFQRRK